MRNLDVTNDLGKSIKMLNITLISRVTARPTRESKWHHVVYKKNRLFRGSKTYDYWYYGDFDCTKHSEAEMLEWLEESEYYKDGKVYEKPVISIRTADGKFSECFYDSDEDMLADLKALQEFNPNLLIVSSI